MVYRRKCAIDESHPSSLDHRSQSQSANQVGLNVWTASGTQLHVQDRCPSLLPLPMRQQVACLYKSRNNIHPRKYGNRVFLPMSSIPSNTPNPQLHPVGWLGNRYKRQPYDPKSQQVGLCNLVGNWFQPWHPQKLDLHPMKCWQAYKLDKTDLASTRQDADRFWFLGTAP